MDKRFNRRQVLKTALGVLLLPLTGSLKLGRVMTGMTPTLAEAATITGGSLSIADIVSVSFPAVLATMRKGKLWANPSLNTLTEEGRILIRPLGAKAFVNGIEYAVKQVQIPTTWSQGDEDKNPTEANKIALVKSLLENTINSSEDNLEYTYLDKYNLIVSREYRTEKTEIRKLPPDTPGHYFHTDTALVMVPKEIDLKTATITTGSTGTEYDISYIGYAE